MQGNQSAILSSKNSLTKEFNIETIYNKKKNEAYIAVISKD